MLNSILKRFPGLSEEDVFLRDDSDGNGVYISHWNSELPQPTMEEVNTWVAEDEASFVPPKSDKERIAELESAVDQLILDALMGV